MTFGGSGATVFHLNHTVLAPAHILKAAAGRADGLDVRRGHLTLAWMTEADPRLPAVEVEDLLSVHRGDLLLRRAIAG
jgi:hypothetical protein